MRLDRNILSRAAVAAVRRGRPFSSGKKGRLLRGIFISSYRRVGIVRSVEHGAAAAADQAPVRSREQERAFSDLYLGAILPFRTSPPTTRPPQRSPPPNCTRITYCTHGNSHQFSRCASRPRPINTQFAILSTQHLRLMPGPPKRGLSRHATHCPQSDVTCCAVVIVFEPALTGA